MKRRWVLIGLVVAANVLLDVTVITLPPMLFAFMLVVFQFSLAPAQGSPLAVWSVLGGKPTPWRSVAAILGVAVLGNLCQFIPYSGYIQACVSILFVCLITTSFVLLPVCAAGARIAAGNRDESPDPEAAALGALQFSLLSLLEWTAAVAVLLGTLPYLLQDLFWVDDGFGPLESVWLLAVHYGVPAALFTLVALRGTLGTGWPRVRLAVLCLGGIAVVVIPGSMNNPGELLMMLLLGGPHPLIIVGSLLLIRRAGYRLVWRRRARL